MKTHQQHTQTVSQRIPENTKAANQAPVEQILQRYKDRILQRQQANEEEEPLQGKFDTAQREGMEDEELLQGKFSETAQLIGQEDEELLQGKFSETAQLQETENPHLGGKGVNNTGLPDELKTGVENLSGYSMDDVRVHYNSAKPAQLQALAYTQGTDIHVAPGQEKHLPHEAWHVVQQKQGRVQPTMQLQGVNVNDNEGLEKEADVMGNLSVTNETYNNFKHIGSPNVNITQLKLSCPNFNNPNSRKEYTNINTLSRVYSDIEQKILNKFKEFWSSGRYDKYGQFIENSGDALYYLKIEILKPFTNGILSSDEILTIEGDENSIEENIVIEIALELGDQKEHIRNVIFPPILETNVEYGNYSLKNFLKEIKSANILFKDNSDNTYFIPNNKGFPHIHFGQNFAQLSHYPQKTSSKHFVHRGMINKTMVENSRNEVENDTVDMSLMTVTEDVSLKEKIINVLNLLRNL